MGNLLVRTSQSIPASAADVSAALSPQQLLTGRTDLLPDETHLCRHPYVPMCGSAAICVRKHTELHLQVANRYVQAKILQGGVYGQCSKYRTGLGSVETGSSTAAHMGQNIAHCFILNFHTKISFKNSFFPSLAKDETQYD